MYKVNKSSKKLEKIDEGSFKQYGIKERQDIQEWIASTPDCLGENLLIIAKEFADFDKTKERFDLLAMDEVGNLVIIENKADDSGSNVEWQAIKYVAYVSTFTKDQILKIYCKYHAVDEETAKNQLCDFLDVEIKKFYETEINDHQRIILVSRSFRDEVTSAVTWLRDQKIDISCVQITPYSNNEEIILDIDIIIPQTINDYTMKMREKIEVAKEEASPKDYTTYSYDGISHYKKNRFVEKVVRDYCSSRSLSEKDLFIAFPDELQGSFGVVREVSKAKTKEGKEYKSSHYFIDSLVVDGKKYWISSE